MQTLLQLMIPQKCRHTLTLGRGLRLSLTAGRLRRVLWQLSRVLEVDADRRRHAAYRHSVEHSRIDNSPGGGLLISPLRV